MTISQVLQHLYDALSLLTGAHAVSLQLTPSPVAAVATTAASTAAAATGAAAAALYDMIRVEGLITRSVDSREGVLSQSVPGMQSQSSEALSELLVEASSETPVAGVKRPREGQGSCSDERRGLVSRSG